MPKFVYALTDGEQIKGVGVFGKEEKILNESKKDKAFFGKNFNWIKISDIPVKGRFKYIFEDLLLGCSPIKEEK